MPRRFCSTCLCKDRKLKPLDNFQVKSTLLEWFEGSTFNVNVEDFITCWECSAKIIHFNKFKRQVFKAQEIRLKVEKKKSARLVNLSALTVYTKETFDMEFVHEERDNGENATDDSEQSLQTRKRESSKRHKEKTHSKSNKKKRKEKESERKEKESEPKVENNVYHIYNYFSNKNTFMRQETLLKTIPKDKTFIDLTSDPKLSSHPIVLLDKVKEEIIVDSDDDAVNNNNLQPEDITIENNNNTVQEDNNLTVVNEIEREENNNINETERDSTIPAVFIDREIKQELIDDYNNQAEKTSLPEITIDSQIIDVSEDVVIKQEIVENDSEEEPEITDLTPDQEHRPTVIMKVELTTDGKVIRMDSSLKFSVVNLTEEEMIEARDKDRNEINFLKHFFKCDSCIVSFDDVRELERHNEDKHSEFLGEFECPICATRFSTESLLTNHEQTHYFSYKCLKCDFAHHRRFVLELHVVKVHDLPLSPVCAACDTEFATQRHLKAHFEKAHKEKLKCNQCGQSFETIDRLKDHAHSHIEKDDLIEIYSCDLCGDNLEGKAAYRAHMQCAHNELAQRAYCEECDRQFTSVAEFKCHLKKSKIHTLFDQQFDYEEDTALNDLKRAQRLLSHSCGLCKKGFSDAIRLKLHIQEKHPEVAKKKPVKDKICPICSEGYISRNALLEHIRTHKAKKPFQCEICDKSFISKALLNKHVRTHALDDIE